MNSNRNLIATIFAKCASSNMQIVTAESCTGGLLASELTKLPGSSKIFNRGYVVYSNQSKVDLLNISEELIKRYGAVSSETVAAMAKNAATLSNITNCISVAVSGVAGPEQSEKKPVGLVWLAYHSKNKSISEQLNFGSLSRQEIREKSTCEALKRLEKFLD